MIQGKAYILVSLSLSLCVYVYVCVRTDAHTCLPVQTERSDLSSLLSTLLPSERSSLSQKLALLTRLANHGNPGTTSLHTLLTLKC